MKKLFTRILLVLLFIGLSSCAKTEEDNVHPKIQVLIYELSEDIYHIKWTRSREENLYTLYLTVTDDFVAEDNFEEYANDVYELWSNTENHSERSVSREYSDLKVVFVTENCHEDPNYEIVYEAFFPNENANVRIYEA